MPNPFKVGDHIICVEDQKDGWGTVKAGEKFIVEDINYNHVGCDALMMPYFWFKIDPIWLRKTKLDKISRKKLNEKNDY